MTANTYGVWVAVYTGFHSHRGIVIAVSASAETGKQASEAWYRKQETLAQEIKSTANHCDDFAEWEPRALLAWQANNPHEPSSWRTAGNGVIYLTYHVYTSPNHEGEEAS